MDVGAMMGNLMGGLFGNLVCLFLGFAGGFALATFMKSYN
jgi:predicted lipid-binding transport protein (Tim44 family)